MILFYPFLNIETQSKNYSYSRKSSLRSPIAVNETSPSIDRDLFLAFALPKSELPRINLAIKILGSSEVSVLQDLEAMHSQVLATTQIDHKCNTNKKGKRQPQPWKKPP